MFQLETLQNCVNASAANIRKQTTDFLSFVYGFWYAVPAKLFVCFGCKIAPVHWNDIKASLDYQLIFCVHSMLVEISLDFFPFSR